MVHTASKSRLIPLAEQKRRRLAVDSADRHCDIETLPAPSSFARSLDERWINGQANADQIAQALVRYHQRSTT